jgi:RNA 2',3'-cyclic 3'-phosphodiesterase
VFLAFFPPQMCRAAIAAQRDRIGDFSSIVTDPRLHMTLCAIHEGGPPDPEMFERVDRAIQGLDLSACWIGLRRLVSNPVAATLFTAGRQRDLRKMRKILVDALIAHDVPVLRPGAFRPHVTLGYGPAWEGQALIEPICWLAQEIVLVDSHVGKTLHRHIARWTLGAPVQGELDLAA